jgi:hypothetical protein
MDEHANLAPKTAWHTSISNRPNVQEGTRGILGGRAVSESSTPGRKIDTWRPSTCSSVGCLSPHYLHPFVCLLFIQFSLSLVHLGFAPLMHPSELKAAFSHRLH